MSSARFLVARLLEDEPSFDPKDDLNELPKVITARVVSTVYRRNLWTIQSETVRDLGTVWTASKHGGLDPVAGAASYLRSAGVVLVSKRPDADLDLRHVVYSARPYEKGRKETTVDYTLHGFTLEDHLKIQQRLKPNLK